MHHFRHFLQLSLSVKNDAELESVGRKVKVVRISSLCHVVCVIVEHQSHSLSVPLLFS